MSLSLSRSRSDSTPSVFRFVQGNLFLNGIHVAFYDLVLGNCSKPPRGEFGFVGVFLLFESGALYNRV